RAFRGGCRRRRDEQGRGYGTGAAFLDKRGDRGERGTSGGALEAGTAADEVEPGLGAGDRNVEQPDPVALPRALAQRGLRHPTPVPLVFHEVKDDDRKLPALEPVCRTDFGLRHPGTLP